MGRPRKEHRDGHKECSGCRRWLLLESYGRDCRRWDGLSSYCRECKAAQNAALGAEYHRRASVKHRLKKNGWDLTVDEYEAIRARGCAICGTHDNIVLDHDHANGRIRDALCRACNVGLGSFRDDPERLRAAAEFLETHADA